MPLTANYSDDESDDEFMYLDAEDEFHKTNILTENRTRKIVDYKEDSDDSDDDEY
ncbi:hypothetical protein ACHAWO_011796 [Cyclotella atomus]|jgi:hypothetical protein|uniref:Uncharacterized protein n=1 Tax=Cyclotella atomus TaxID=382360 RepID=A0ABD3NY79_9STRA